MNVKMFSTIYDYYKQHYGEIEKNEIYKWEAVVQFQNTWDIEAQDFADMLRKSLSKTNNLMSSGNYYPRKMIVWAAEKEPETVRELFRRLFDLNVDIKERIMYFRSGVEDVIQRHKEGTVSKSYQDDRAIMVYLNMKYPEKYYLYKYSMFTKFAELIDYAELPKAGDITLLFVFESMCEMILNRVLEDEELLHKYEERRKKYYDPEYHLLVQDIIYSCYYFETPELLDEEEQPIELDEFELNVINKPIVLKGSHVDYIQEAKHMKEIGDAGEEFVYQFERAQIKKYKLGPDKQVRRVAKLDGDGLGYDILSYDDKGNEIYIEVKTTTGPANSSIFVSANELHMSEMNAEQYYLYRVYDFDFKNMRGAIQKRKGSLKPLCITAQTYKVDFK